MRTPTLTAAALTAATSISATMDNTSDIGFETNFGVPTTCTDTDADVTIKRGADVSVGSTIATLDRMELTGCTFSSLDFAVQMTFGPSDIKVRSDVGVDAGDPIPVDIEVDADVHGTGCNYQITGSIRGVLYPGTGSPDGTIALQNGFDAVIDTAGGSPTGSSCGGEYVAGDLVQATGGDFELTTGGTGAGPINHS